MSENNLIDEIEEEKIIKSTVSSQLLTGVYPKKQYIDKIKIKYKKENEIAEKLIEQNKEIVKMSNNNFEKSMKINKNFDEIIKRVENNLGIIKNTFIGKDEKPTSKEVNSRLYEFNRIKNLNENKIKKLNEEISEIERKQKENTEFMEKYSSEKKVWLDRLKEDLIIKETYSNGFKYLYEAKIIKLLFEGVLLEKVQDKIENEMYKKGAAFEWNILDESQNLKIKKEEENKLNNELINLDIENAINKEKEFKEKMENEEIKNDKLKIKILNEFKEIYNEIWIPNYKVNKDADREIKRNIMINITMQVTFELFKQYCFDAFKFKNILLSNEEYAILDKIGKYFPESEISGRTQEENSLQNLMNIIDFLKFEQDIIYYDLNEANLKIKEYKKNLKGKNITSIQRLENIIDKIKNVQERVKKNGSTLIKEDLMQIKLLIKQITDEKEKKLFEDHLIDNNRLYDEFLPLSNILMVICFMSIGEKKNRNYEKKIKDNKNEIIKLKSEINEISGKKTVLDEIKSKFNNDELIQDIIDKSSENEMQCFEKSQQLLEEAKISLNKIIALKNQQQMDNITFLKKLRKLIIRPKDIC